MSSCIGNLDRRQKSVQEMIFEAELKWKKAKENLPLTVPTECHPVV